MSLSSKADFYLNFHKLGDLKLLARNQSEDASIAVSQQFEGLFLQQMLAAMRSASQIDSGQHSSYVDFYQEMHDKQLAQTIAKQGNLGVAKLIMQQLPGGNVSTSSAALPPGNPGVIAGNQESELKEAAALNPQSKADSVLVSKVLDNDFAEVSEIQRNRSGWQSPQQFVADIWPQAQKAASTLGVSPALLIAQAALETGWGKHTMKFEDGRNSYNLFGIKAGGDWKGAVLNRSSLEYSGGVLSNEIAQFRAYASPAQSLADYVNLIHSSPRYRHALEQVGNDHAYIREIQDAGYATDPQYANKVISILTGEVLQNSLQSLNLGVSDHA